MTSTVDEALQVCEAITREQARNFFYGIRLLPAAKRSGLCALYALSRRVDDIGDGESADGREGGGAGRICATSLNHADTSTDPVLVGVAATARRFPVPMGAFGELIDGVEMDVRGRTYETFDELGRILPLRGRRGGAAVSGRVRVRRPRTRSASDFADALGIALQQTNILRDIREDLGNGRIYLPQRRPGPVRRRAEAGRQRQPGRHRRPARSS